MIDALLGLIAPHYCISCTKLGTVLCDNCKQNITSEPLQTCIVCRRPLVNNKCNYCTTAYIYFDAYFKRDGIIKQTIDQYKFHGIRPLASVLARLLDTHLPYFPGKTIYVSVPTARSHVRERGFDHLDTVCREFARRRKINYIHLIDRKNNAHQIGAKKKQRIAQTKDLYVCRQQLDESTTYVVIDDVVTTGATLEACAHALYMAGARKIAVVAIAYQPSN